MKLYISDLHFYQSQLNTQLDMRGFESAEAMNSYMIRQWNSKVQGGDIVIVIGDFIGTKKPHEVNAILRKLNGKICLIEGNHDKDWLGRDGVDYDRFEWIKPYAELDDHGNTVILSHYPTFCYNHQHTKKSDGSPRTYMLYGHVHNSPDEKLVNQFQEITRQTIVTNAKGVTGPIPCQMINTFCMFSDYKPLSLEEWIKVDMDRRAALPFDKLRTS